MKVFGYEELKNAPSDGVIAIGFFDGVHSAHRRLISEAQSDARKRGVPFGILTFASESGIKKGISRLYSTEERLRIFKEVGADFTVSLDFEKICTLTPEQFVKDILIGGLGAGVAYAGYNFRFGKNAEGKADDLKALMEKYGKSAVICDEITYGGKTISSTVIRTMIESGDVERANLLLGAPYRISGETVRGNGKGHSLGFPTVNTSLTKDKVIPKNGVYRSLVKIKDEFYNGVTNIGVCPTFGEREVHPETYIIDFSKDVYGEDVTVFLLGYIREERTFCSEDELKMQIKVDIDTTIKKNGEEKWQELGLK